MKTQFLLSTVALLSLSACQSTMPRYDSEFGDSVHSSLNAQVVNPQASSNTDPVAGIDGRAARDVIQSYQRSFTRPTPEPGVFSLGVGTTGSGGGDN